MAKLRELRLKRKKNNNVNNNMYKSLICFFCGMRTINIYYHKTFKCKKWVDISHDVLFNEIIKPYTNPYYIVDKIQKLCIKETNRDQHRVKKDDFDRIVLYSRHIIHNNNIIYFKKLEDQSLYIMGVDRFERYIISELPKMKYYLYSYKFKKPNLTHSKRMLFEECISFHSNESNINSDINTYSCYYCDSFILSFCFFKLVLQTLPKEIDSMQFFFMHKCILFELSHYFDRKKYKKMFNSLITIHDMSHV